MTLPWRFFDTGPASGPFNMGLDEAILAAHAQALVPPTVRVYAWERPTLSLGYAQRDDLAFARGEGVKSLLERCRGAGLEVVRRPTGGRAILHHLEITYSVVIRTSLLGGESSISRSYRFLCRGLAIALERLGIQVDFSAGSDGTPPFGKAVPQMCFAVGSRSDVVVNGAKVVGSAQARKNGALLQHGSIPLGYDEGLQAAVFGQTFCQSLEEGKITSLERAAGRPIAYEEAARAIREGFRDLFDVEGDQAPPEERELALARRLAEKKYAILT